MELQNRPRGPRPLIFSLRFFQLSKCPGQNIVLALSDQSAKLTRNAVSPLINLKTAILL